MFYSGHGVPGVNDGRGYLLPVDADPKAAEDDGYPIDLLYGNLSGLAEAETVWVYLDACFSGGSPEGVLIKNASPVFVTASLPEGVGEKVMSLTAASGEQIASWDTEAGYGLFTHHLLDALYGGGDADGDGRVTALEAKAYLDRHMTRAARRQYRRVQEASLLGAEGVVLAAAPAHGMFPARPALDDPDPAAGATGDEDGGGNSAPPTVDHAAVELSLGLERSENTLVQHGLASAGFPPGDIDGLIGGNTRVALSAWQVAQGHEATGYLTADHAKALMAAGETAQREQAAREQAERERKEREKVERERAAKEQAAREAKEREEAERRAREEAERKARPEESSPAAKKLSGLLRRPFSPTAVDENGWTDLHYAAILNMPEVAKSLLDAGADPEARLLNDGTPLTGKLAQAMRLMGRSLDGWKRRGYSPLYLAALWNSAETVEELIVAGADVNAAVNGETPLHVAAWSNAGAIIAKLIAGLADVNARDSGGRTPLHLAAMQGALDAADKLISGHADSNARSGKSHFMGVRTGDGWTPLHMAARFDRHEVAALLINNRADINAADKTGNTPLHQTVCYETSCESYETAKLLIAYGADVDAMPLRDAGVDGGGRNWAPLHRAASTGALRIVELLLKNQADPNLRFEESGDSPLDCVNPEDDEKNDKMRSLIQRYGGRSGSGNCW